VRQNWDQIIRDIDDDGAYFVHATVQREDIEKWIHDVCEMHVGEPQYIRHTRVTCALTLHTGHGTDRELIFHVS
jgi:hypothetical protein